MSGYQLFLLNLIANINVSTTLIFDKGGGLIHFNFEFASDVYRFLYARY